MNWFKSLLAEKEPEKVYTKMNISEPIFSIVKSVQNNPIQWETRLWSELSNTYTTMIKVRDKKTGLEFTVVSYGHTGNCFSLDWATDEERTYLANAILKLYTKRYARYERMLDRRTAELYSKIRSDWKEIYK